MYQARQIADVFVGSASVAATANASLASLNGLANGEVRVFAADGSVLLASEASAATKFFIGMKTANGDVLTSPMITKADIKTSKYKAYSAPAAQVSYFGYNGTTNAIIAPGAVADIRLKLALRESLVSSQPTERLLYATCVTTAADTAETIALKLMENGNANLAKEADKAVLYERVCSGAGEALGTGTATSATIVFTKGSKLVTGFANVDDATTNTVLAVGDYLRIGTNLTDPVYEIAAMDTTANTLTLDSAYVGATQTVDDTALNRVDEASLGNFGIKMTGQAPKYKLGKFYNDVVRFTPVAGTAYGVVSTPVAASKGSGAGQEIADLEWWAAGFKGEIYRMGEPHIYENPLNANQSGSYDLIYFSWTKSDAATFGPENITADQQVYIAVPTSRPGYADGGTDDLDTVMNALISDLGA